MRKWNFISFFSRKYKPHEIDLLITPPVNIYQIKKNRIPWNMIFWRKTGETILKIRLSKRSHNFNYSPLPLFLSNFFMPPHFVWLLKTPPRSQSVETWCSYIARCGFWKQETFFSWTHMFYVISLITWGLVDIKINSFFGGSNFSNICCCASLLKSSLPT